MIERRGSTCGLMVVVALGGDLAHSHTWCEEQSWD